MAHMTKSLEISEVCVEVSKGSCSKLGQICVFMMILSSDYFIFSDIIRGKDE